MATWGNCHLGLDPPRYFVLSLKPGIEFAFFDRIKSMILKAVHLDNERPRLGLKDIEGYLFWDHTNAIGQHLKKT